MATVIPSKDEKTNDTRRGIVKMAKRLVSTVSMSARAMLPLACPVKMTPDDMVVGPKKKTARPYANSGVWKGMLINPKERRGVSTKMIAEPYRTDFHDSNAFLMSFVFSLRPEIKKIKKTLMLDILIQSFFTIMELHQTPGVGRA